MLLLFVFILLTQGAGKALSSSASDPDLPDHCLRAHNDYRNRHKASKLQWSTELAEEAKKWAEHLAAIDQMERDSNTKDGENIFYMYGGDPSEACDRAVENWYSEVRNYDFKDPHENPSTDHFSQIVWKNTKDLGVGTAQSKSGNFFLVARYRPSGNADGSFQDNVEAASDANIKGESLESTSTRPPNEAAKEESPAGPPSIARKLSGHSALPDQIFESEPSAKSEHGRLEKVKETKDGLAPPMNPGADMLMAPPKYGKDYQVEIRFPTIQFTEKMNSPQSKEYHDVKLAITSAILQLYEDFPPFQEVQLLGLRNGSVIATLGLIFSKIGHNYLDRLTEKVAAGKLGELDVTRDYVAADVLPDGYLKLTIPNQNTGSCPAPCANPTKCYPDGCSITCCQFDAVINPTEAAPPQETHSVGAPLPAPAPGPAPVCPATCPPSCAPACSAECCNDKPMDEPAPTPAVTAKPAVPTTGPSALMFPGYTCPAPSCPASCFPDCNDDCCGSPEVNPSCSDQCNRYCSTECPQECCDRKSRVHPRHPGKPFVLPPLNHGMYPKPSFMYRPKNSALRTPIKHFKPALHTSQRINPYSYSTLWQPYMKLAQEYGYGAKRGTARSKVSPKAKPQPRAPPKPRVTPNIKIASQNRFMQSPRQQRSPYYGRIQKSNYYGNGHGMKLIQELKSKGTPVNVKYAYRYGNRLLVPVDLPKDMEFKEMKGKKFISVPAFRRNEIPHAGK